MLSSNSRGLMFEDNVREAALKFSRAGISVLPTRKDKKPALTSWVRWQKERADEQQILLWFQNGANLAVVCGAISGRLCVLDFDEPELFFKWKSQNGILLENLPVQKTGRGYHVFFKSQRTIRTAKIASKIDLRGEGRYVVVAPSIHSNGRAYQLIQGDLTSIPTLVEDDVETLLQTARAVCERVPYPSNASLENSIEIELAKLTHATEGTRNDTLNKVAFSIGQFVRAGAVNRDQAERLLHDKALRIGLSETETRATIRSGIEAGIRKSSLALEPSHYDGEADAYTRADWLPTNIVMDALRRGEIGDAEIFAQLFDGKVCFDHLDQIWNIWEGQHWKPDRTNAVIHYIANDVAAQYLYTATIKQRAGGDDAERVVKELYSRTNALRFRNRITNVLALAAAQPSIAIVGDERDANPMLLAVSNGVLDLQTAQLLPGQPFDYIHGVAPTEWLGLNAPAERWQMFLDEIFDGDKATIDFIRRWFGYCLTGDVGEDAFVVLFGERGRNGKRILTETIARIQGDYAAMGDDDIFLDGHDRAAGAPKQYLVDLARRRLVLLSEAKEGSRFHLARIKRLSGGDTIAARAAFGKRGQQIPPTWKFVVSTNRMPHADPDDAAFFERIYVVPFTQSFVANPDPRNPNEHLRDTHLERTLRGESPGILAWLVRGCLDFQQDGLRVPETVRYATRSYREREDTLGRFISEKCRTIDPTAQVRAGEIYECYKAWCDAGNLAPMNITIFGKRMGMRFSKNESHGIYYLGIELARA